MVEQRVWENVHRERDELRAENKALEDQAFDLTERLLQCSTENERLREERDRFERRVVDYVHALGQSRAENERLTLADRQWADHVKRLSEDNEQLRAAIAELQQDVERLQQQRAEQVLTSERLRAAAQAVVDCPLLENACQHVRALRETLD